MRKQYPILILVCLMALISLSSCVVAEKLTLNDQYVQTKAVRGKSHVDLSVDDFFVSVIEDLSNWDSTGSNDAIIDVAIQDFVKNLQSSKAASSISFIETGYNTYMGDFSFSNFNQLITDLAKGNSKQTIVTMNENKGKTHVAIHIDMDNYSQLTEIIPFLADPNFEVYGPLYNHDLSQDEYLEMMGFILGDECPDSILKSSVKIQVVAPVAVSAHNGKARNSKTIEFTFPLIDFMLLHNPIDFWLEY